MDNFIRDLQRTTNWPDGNIIQTFIDFVIMWNIEDDCKAHFAQAAGLEDHASGEAQ